MIASKRSCAKGREEMIGRSIASLFSVLAQFSTTPTYIVPLGCNMKAVSVQELFEGRLALHEELVGIEEVALQTLGNFTRQLRVQNLTFVVVKLSLRHGRGPNDQERDARWRWFPALDKAGALLQILGVVLLADLRISGMPEKVAGREKGLEFLGITDKDRRVDGGDKLQLHSPGSGPTGLAAAYSHTASGLGQSNRYTRARRWRRRSSVPLQSGRRNTVASPELHG